LVIWVLSNYLSNIVRNYQEALWLNRIIFSSTTILAWFLFLFGSAYPRNDLVINRRVLYIGYLLTFIIAVLGSTSLVVEDVRIHDGYSDITFGSLSIIYIAHFVILFASFIFTLISKLFKSNGLERIKIQYLVSGIALSGFGAIVTNLLLPLSNIFAFTNYGPFFFIIFIGLSCISILKHRLFGLNYLFGSFLKFIVINAITVLYFYSLYFLQIQLWGNVITLESVLTSIFLGFGFVFFFNFMNKRISDFLDRNFSFSKVDINRVKDNFIKEISTDLRVQSIASYTSKVINKSLESRFAYIVLQNIKTKALNQYSDGDVPSDNSYLKQICAFVSTNYMSMPSVYVREELNFSRIKSTSFDGFEELNKLLDRNGIGTLVNLDLNGKFMGFILIGTRDSKRAYTYQDIDFIKYLKANVSIALSRAILYQEVEDFSDTLQVKVDKATSALQVQKAELQRKYQFEKDMMGIMGHELRTPMTVARGLAEILLQKAGAGKGMENDYLKEKLEKIFNSINKESDLIQTLLSTSHIDNQKVNLQVSNFDLNELIDYAMFTFKKDADAKKLKLTFEESKDKLPTMNSDQSRIQEIINNLISNAIKYTNEGSVKVSVESKEDMIHFTVQDSGIGIPENEINNIGKKFYRIHQHLDQKKDIVRAGGTGLGLYVVNGLLDIMGGKLIIKSEEGKGSTFTAVFPVELKQNDRVLLTEDRFGDNDMFDKMGLKGK
jgi:signal transduction histidine kinase